MEKKTLFQEVVDRAEKEYPKYTQERLDFIKSVFLAFLTDGKMFCEIYDSKGDLYAVSDRVEETKLLSNDRERGFHFQVLMIILSNHVLVDHKGSIGPWRLVLNSESLGKTTFITEYRDNDTKGIGDRWKVTFDFHYEKNTERPIFQERIHQKTGDSE